MAIESGHPDFVPKAADTAVAITIVGAGQPSVIEQFDLGAERHVVVQCVEQPLYRRAARKPQNSGADAFKIVQMNRVERPMLAQKHLDEPNRDGVDAPTINAEECVMRGRLDGRIQQGERLEARVVVGICCWHDARTAAKRIFAARGEEPDLDIIAAQQLVDHVAQIDADPAPREFGIIELRPVIEKDLHFDSSAMMRLTNGVNTPRPLWRRLPCTQRSSAIQR